MGLMELITSGSGLILGIIKGAIEMRGQLQAQKLAYDKALLDALLLKMGAITEAANAAMKRTEKIPWIVPVFILGVYFAQMLLPAFLVLCGIPIGVQTETISAATGLTPEQVDSHWIILWGYPILRENVAILMGCATYVLGTMPTKLTNRF